MDFIVGLLEVKEWERTYAGVEELSKYAHFLP